MYQCQICQKVVPPRTKAFRIPVEFRSKTYHEPLLKRFKTKWRVKEKTMSFTWLTQSRYNHPIDNLFNRIYITGHWQEIVREVTACPTCAAQLQAQQAE